MRLKKDNYTQLPVGTRINGKETKKCPRCQRAGLARETKSKTYYTHVKGVELDEHQNFVARFDLCPEK